MSLELKNVSYTYSMGTAYEIQALKEISVEIPQGQFVGLIGHTGCGKSTLIQHLNGLLKPTSGQVLFQGRDIWEDGYDRRSLRFHVGLVFQNPDYQLFETDVLRDVCFGPKNMGLTEEECEQRAKTALIQTGAPEEIWRKSPFDLSGGQKRRVAIAGILAMDPDVLVLDEPTAGLDPKGRTEILEQIADLHKERGITVILVSHSMEDMASYAERLLVLEQGQIRYDGTPREVFSHYRELEKIDLAAPQITYLMHALKEKGFAVDESAATVEEAKKDLLKVFEKYTGNGK